jgi:histidine triad (HIT) family protein
MSIFTKIISGEIPCFKVYESSAALAFLDISPVCKGHTLVIPKREVENIFDLEKEDYEGLMEGIYETAALLKEKLGADGINIFSSSGEAAGQTVMHLHFHLLPRFEGDGLKTNIHENPVLEIDLKALYSGLFKI